jgi:hypothetical protein
MAVNPDLVLWRTVLAVALREDDAAEWIITKDAAMVCALAQVEHEAVMRAYRANGDVLHHALNHHRHRRAGGEYAGAPPK